MSPHASTSPIQPPAVGEVFYFTVSGVTYAGSESSAPSVVSKVGQEVTVTEELLRANTDRTGRCWLDLLHDRDGQVARFGSEVITLGHAPAELITTDPNTREHYAARERALAEAHAIPDPAQRKERVRQVYDAYGRPSTSRTMQQYGGAQ